MRGQHRHLVGQLGGEPVRGGVLRPGQPLGQPGLHQIRPPHAADQQRSAGEGGHRPPVVLQDVRGVVRGVAGRGHRPQRQPLVDLLHVPVGHRHPRIRHGRPGGHEIAGAGEAGQLQTAGHVVVVHMRLGDGDDPYTPAGGRGDHPVDVARRVHHDHRPGSARQIAPVAQTFGLQDVGKEHGTLPRHTIYPPGYLSSP